ncbi:winged helix-turn-helix domain-containing protein [Chthonobacter rhizosphaerae]|uniref:winged helix-turn-helix domain-containing protein n=1 Tax=Chthonobacter rhizosphaerae TaxID=2735553 RepID=UPI0015EF8A52|nr:LysR family transcriptional regulator [Chthonobacter rhizosphaerae]
MSAGRLLPDPTSEQPGPAPVSRLKLRVDVAGGGRIGPGKIDLVDAVARTGSITAAGREMGMSYRRAWLLLDALNRMFDEPVVTTSVGGAHGGGAVVTPFGHALVAAYRALEDDAARAAADRLGAILAKVRPDGGATAGDDA